MPKSLKSVNFRQSYSKTKKAAIFKTQCSYNGTLTGNRMWFIIQHGLNIITLVTWRPL